MNMTQIAFAFFGAFVLALAWALYFAFDWYRMRRQRDEARGDEEFWREGYEMTLEELVQWKMAAPARDQSGRFNKRGK